MVSALLDVEAWKRGSMEVGATGGVVDVPFSVGRGQPRAPLFSQPFQQQPQKSNATVKYRPTAIRHQDESITC